MPAMALSAPAARQQQDFALRTLRRAVQLHSAKRAEAAAASTVPSADVPLGGGSKKTPSWNGCSQSDLPPTQPPTVSQLQLSQTQPIGDATQASQEFGFVSQQKNKFFGGAGWGASDSMLPATLSTQTPSNLGPSGNLEFSQASSQPGAFGCSQGPPPAWFTTPSISQQGGACGGFVTRPPPPATGGFSQPIWPTPESQSQMASQGAPNGQPVTASAASAALSSDVAAAAAALAAALGVNNGASIGGPCSGGGTVVGARNSVTRVGGTNGAGIVAERADCGADGASRRRVGSPKLRDQSPRRYRRNFSDSSSPHKRRSSRSPRRGGGRDRRREKASPPLQPKRRRMRQKAPPPPSPSSSASASLSDRGCHGGSHSDMRSDAVTTPSRSRETLREAFATRSPKSTKSNKRNRHSSTRLRATRCELSSLTRIASEVSADTISRLGLGLRVTGQEYSGQCVSGFAGQEEDAREALALVDEYRRSCAESDSALEGVAKAIEAALAAASSALLMRPQEHSARLAAAKSLSAPPSHMAPTRAGLLSAGSSVGLGCLQAPRRRRAIDGIVAPARV
eukprot:TRINITY_DN15835_c0_g1_i1.p1 TRINITY_DN15835_c0_g1~~TRINITY_DN15835_c0_g1_i1.p1  ORF type:complete len:604 (+),score=101.84 TRINITY_DN15835_c0_g1_i1:110-1813(+)